MKIKILYNIPVWIAMFLLHLFVACSGPDVPEAPEAPESGLYLNIATIGQSRAGVETLLDNEKMKSLRVVVLHKNGTVEHNNTYSLLGGEDDTKRIYLKVTPNEKKKIFLFANEESVDKVSFLAPTATPLNETSLTDFFKQYPKGTAGFEAAVSNLYFAPDYSSGKAIPMSSTYEIEMENGYVEKTFYLVRVATKFTINFENQRDTEVKLNSFTISSHADKNFLMARVNDSEQNRRLFNGKTWIEWLKEVSDASSETDTEAAGWLKDYELPSPADLTKAYESGEITVGAWSPEISTPVKRQTVFYLPESKNLKAETSDGEQEYTLTLNIDGVREPFVRKLPNLKALFRNTHVVINITMTSLIDIRIEVRDWDSEEILAQFRDPIYLHVEKQEYPIAAGEVTEVWFKSDVEDVYVESPLYRFGDKDIPLYKYEREYSSETQEGILKIYVNENIPTSEYNRILTETDKYDFFHIVAESIHKRIKVTPLTLEYYLNVTPLNIPIDVSTRISSSDYEGIIPITIQTNYPSLTVALSESTEWASINNSATAYLKLLSPGGSEVSLTSPSSISVGSSGNAIYQLAFKGLNTGSDIWKNKKYLELTVIGNDDNISSEPIPVSINIIPLVQDYVIHFKANGWSKPHIYVYECLEFPADWPGTYSPGNGKPEESLASKPLGYYGGKENGKDAYYAALEYSFTGAIAFNGWDVPANLETLYYTNGSPRPFDGYKAQGFYIFNTDQDSWKPNLPEKAGIRYSFNMDFCAEHREAIKGSCTHCANTSSMNRLWPGIMMKYEGDGWWVFTLTGIATPGKALIMFADGHSGNNDNRYPGAAEVGVPLFDYPSKEGWLRYNGDMTDRVNNQFSSVKPAD